MFATSLRRLSPLLLLLSLAACHHTEHRATLAPTERLLEKQLADGDLPAATDSFRRLQQGPAQPAPNLEGYQRRLAEAWLQRGQKALERGDMKAAATALGNARALMPQAPALTDGLDGRLKNDEPAAETP